MSLRQKANEDAEEELRRRLRDRVRSCDVKCIYLDMTYCYLAIMQDRTRTMVYKTVNPKCIGQRTGLELPVGCVFVANGRL